MLDTVGFQYLSKPVPKVLGPSGKSLHGRGIIEPGSDPVRLFDFSLEFSGVIARVHAYRKMLAHG